MTALLRIEDLPDYPALQQLSRALWRQGTARGAALLVGAGFSKNAERAAADTPEAPLWIDFAQSMAEQLYPLDPAQAPRDPLRLADEYRAYFGRSSLDQLIRSRILDAAWRPGQLHGDLLKLEWSDVLTTNWDTLLERAAENVKERAYEVVRAEADLAHMRSPRIVKLHGSLGATEHFILTEEDYRTYPTKFAAFVNYARQIFIENELCLLGFSGDDPNFLQWSGWVRDNLGGSARRIYFVGVLNMAPSKRKLLEARNVAPIDLAPLVDCQSSVCHEKATRIFIDFLVSARPKLLHDWQPAPTADYNFLPKTAEDQRRLRDASYVASILDQAGAIWEKDRKSYPGWLICPAGLRDELDFGINVCQTNELAIKALPLRRQAEILYEIVWRKETALSPIDEKLVPLLANLVSPVDTQHLTSKQCLEIVKFLMKTARRAGDRSGVEHWAEILLPKADRSADLCCEVAYQRCLEARDRLDFASMRTQIEKMSGRDPVWLLRSAALLFELGDDDEAAKLIFDAQANLEERQRRDPGSLWIQSRRAWTEWIARAVRLNRDLSIRRSRWSREFKEINCDPEDEIDRIENASAAEIRRMREEEYSSIPPFQAGEYRARSIQPRKRGKSRFELMAALDQMLEIAGAPMRLNWVTIATSAALDAASLSFEETARWYTGLVRALQVPWGAEFERYFSRIVIACLPLDEVNALSENVRTGVIYWQSKMDSSDQFNRTNAFQCLRLLIEVLARLTVRQNPGLARSNLNLAQSLAKRPWANHHHLNESLGNLIQNSILALPLIGQQDIVFSLLDFPLAHGAIRYTNSWPEPFNYLRRINISRKAEDRHWNAAISDLIKAAAPDSDQRAMAILRLTCLFRGGALSDAEQDAFGTVLWAELDESSGLPNNTFLLAFMFAELPSPNDVDKEGLVRDHLFDVEIGQFFEIPTPCSNLDIEGKFGHLQAMALAVQGSIRPLNDQAIRLFDSIVGWRLPASNSRVFQSIFWPQLHGNAGRLLGDILRFTVVPALTLEHRTSDRAHALLTFIREVSASTAAGALPYFMSDDDTTNAEIVNAIQRGVVGRAQEEVAGATKAVELWALDRSIAQDREIPYQIVDRVISALESGHEAGSLVLLHCVLKLIEHSILLESEKSRITYLLGEMLADYQYEKIDPESRQAITISLVRVECVRIANALKKAGIEADSVAAWLDAVSSDPLPEVRFSLEPYYVLQ
jgi:hypothetical protein